MMGSRAPFIFSYRVGLLALMLGGCTLFGGGGDSPGGYTLEVVRVLEQPSPQARERILEVVPFRISPRYRSRLWLYQEAGSWHRVEEEQAFLIPPQVLVTEQASTYFRRSGLFGAVVEGESRLQVTHLLEGAVTALYGDFSDPMAPRAVMEIQFFLIDPRLDPPKTLLKSGFRVEAEILAATPQALIQGWNNGLESILENFENDLRRLFDHSSRG
ncbi:hypothetical protein NOC27_2126 [Nitrosococcus oceani AFC27]|nr:hypothetical protein [Nitrosococcus oceani]EDZ65446.1 hypothetical protein NOC27_2126 [Nitrosococcus oceani AFC27]KFI20838.1 hypothetical protein IB75_00845 [Nitrosococcus oceani C-27]GEM21635.1 hypothetical protein NONS58_30840 [Nitrosococcus oceani]